MIVFAAVLPHTPILLPQIGKEHTKQLKKTREALALLQADFKAAQPDIVIVIGAHGDIFPNAFTIETMPEYTANFEAFGEFETRYTLRGSIEFINRFKEQVETTFPLMLQSSDGLDYSISVPLTFLSAEYKDFKLVPIHNSLLGYQQHVEFGEALKEAIFNENKRVAVIASGELSHRLSPKGPAGFSPRAKEFDKKLIQLLKQKKTESLITLDKRLIADAQECGLRAILMLHGVLKDMNYDFQVLSYESPFGTGYLVAECKLK